MSNFMTLCEDSVVDFITRVEQPIQTMEVSVLFHLGVLRHLQDFILGVDK